MCAVTAAAAGPQLMEIDDRLLLNDIIPPGRHGEGCQSTATRAALERYAREVNQYETQKLSPDVNHEAETNGPDKQTSHPAPNPSVFQTVPPDDTATVSGPITSHHDETDTDEHDDDSLDENDANDHNVDTPISRHHETPSEQQEKTDQTGAQGEDNRGSQDRAQERAGW